PRPLIVLTEPSAYERMSRQLIPLTPARAPSVAAVPRIAGQCRSCPPCIAHTNGTRSKSPHWTYTHTKAHPRRLRPLSRAIVQQSRWPEIACACNLHTDQAAEL